MKFRHTIAIVLALCLLAPAAALATPTDELIAIGSVVGGAELAVKAPFTGELDSFALREGDAVAAGEALFSVSTNKLYASEAGTVGFVAAQDGDSADAVTSRYGALMFMEPEHPFVIETDASGAYDDRDNRYLHIGERVYIKSRSSGDYTGEGTIVKLSGEKYTVEVTDGNLRYDEPVYLYREDDYASDSRIGKGDITRVDPIAVTAQGTVLKVHVAEGDPVAAGELLLEYAPDALEPDDSHDAQLSALTAEQDGVISKINVTQGASVTKGQTLALIYPRGGMQVAVDVSETDVVGLTAGQPVRVELENLNTGMLSGAIASISGLGVGDDDSYYTVYVDFEASQDVRIGMSAVVHFGA